MSTSPESLKHQDHPSPEGVEDTQPREPWVLKLSRWGKAFVAAAGGRSARERKRFAERGDEERLSWVGTVAYLALLISALLMLRTVRQLHGEDEPLSDAGLLTIMAALLVVFAAVRRIVATLVGVTRGEARERDLWRADRILFWGLLLLFLPVWIAHEMLGFEKAEAMVVLTVMTALLVIGPVTEWARNDGVWSLVKERRAKKIAERE